MNISPHQTSMYISSLFCFLFNRNQDVAHLYYFSRKTLDNYYRLKWLITFTHLTLNIELINLLNTVFFKYMNLCICTLIRLRIPVHVQQLCKLSEEGLQIQCEIQKVPKLYDRRT